jgi:hypothetical protein
LAEGKIYYSRGTIFEKNSIDIAINGTKKSKINQE